jgi:serine/threonine protein kinase
MNESTPEDQATFLEALLNGETGAEAAEPLDEQTQQAFALLNRIHQAFMGAGRQAGQFSPGDRWGNLTIEARLGAGGLGEVYQAFDHVLSRQVAVKFLHPHTDQLISAEAFINEARRLAKVRHHLVMAVFGAQTHRGITGFWAEKLSGQTLDQLKPASLSRQSRLDLMQQLSTAVKAIHQQDMVHADIKPHNVMLVPGRGPVLMDFGAGRDLSLHTESVIPGLTPLAMAPELFTGSAVSQASDVYALGLVFYYLLSDGGHPHAAAGREGLEQAVTDPTQPAIGALLTAPRAWRQLISRMCDQNPQNRPPIERVEQQLSQWQAAPGKRLKRIALGSFIGFLLISLGTLTYGYVRVEKERRTTQLALQETQSINELIADFILSVSPSRQGKDVLLIDALHQLAGDVTASQALTQNNRAVMLGNLGMSQFYVGYHDQGIALVKQAMQTTGMTPDVQVKLRLMHSRLLDEHPDLDSSSQTEQVRSGLAAARQMMARHQVSDAESLANMDYLQGRLAERNTEYELAEQHYQQALAYWQSLPSGKHNELVQFTILTSLGNVASHQFDMAVAGRYYRQALEKAQQHTSVKYNSNLMVAFTNMATYLAQTGDIQAAIEAFTELLDQTKQYFGETHHRTLTLVINLLNASNQAEQFEQSASLITSYEPAFAALKEDKSLLSLHFLSVKANTQAGLGDYATAGETYQQVIRLSQDALGDQHPMTLTNQVNLAENHNLTGHPQLAISLLTGPLETARSMLGEDHEITVYMYQTLAESHHQLNHHEQAVKLMHQVLDARQEQLGSEHPATIQAQNMLTSMQQSSGD